MAMTEDKPPAAPPQPTRRPEFDVSISRAIDRIRKRNPKDASLALSTSCFGELWADADGICPNDGVNGDLCALRNDCEATFKEAQAAILAADQPPPPPKKQPVKKPKAQLRRNGETPEHGKWKGTDKYARHGYESMNRPVDKGVEALIQALGNPHTLPRIWSPINFQDKYGGLGPIVMSQTTSYTSVLVHGQTLVRCWTNAAGCMIVDVAPDLIEPVSKLKGVRLRAITSGSLKKLRPCTHRFDLVFGTAVPLEVLTAIGIIIKHAYTP